MNTKGTTIVIFKKFIESKFGEEAYKQWVDTLENDEVKKVFAGIVITSKWYSVKDFLIEPTRKIADLFYSGDAAKAAYEIGRASAEFSLTGIYKFFVKLGTPHFTMKKANTIFPTYYENAVMEIAELEEHKVVSRITKFDEMDIIIEERVKGWIEKALELSGQKNIKNEITKSLTKGDEYTELITTWED